VNRAARFNKLQMVQEKAAKGYVCLPSVAGNSFASITVTVGKKEDTVIVHFAG